MAQVFGSAGRSAFAMGDSRYKGMLSRFVLPMLSFLLLIPVGYYLLTRGHLFWGAVVAVIYVISIKSLEEAGLNCLLKIYKWPGCSKMVRCEEQRKSRPEAYFDIREGLDFLQ